MRFHQAAAAVWDDSAAGGDRGNSSPTPKLSLFSLPAGVKGLRHSPGLPPPTPPINRLVSVPFKWEEAPGKPRPRRIDHHYVADGDHQSKVNRCLELPPRLVVSGSSNSSSRRVSNTPSPACMSFQQEDDSGGGGGDPAAPRRSMSFTSGRPPPPAAGRGVGSGSTRWGNLVTKMTSTTVRNNKDQQVANFDSTEIISSYANDRSSGERNVKITRIRRRRSLFNLSAASRPQACLNSVYRSFRKIMMVVPTRRS